MPRQFNKPQLSPIADAATRSAIRPIVDWALDIDRFLGMNFSRSPNGGTTIIQPTGGGAFDYDLLTNIPWTNEGSDTVRLTVSSKNVGIGTSTPGAKLGVIGSVVATVVGLFKAAAGQTAAILQMLNSNGRNAATFDFRGGLSLGNSTDISVPAFIRMGYQTTDFGIADGATKAILTWGSTNSNLGPPTCTADEVGCVGARIYTYKDANGFLDNGYGQDSSEAWVLVSDSSVPYTIYTGYMSGTNRVRATWSGTGNMDNRGRIWIRKYLGAGPATPELRLEETSAGNNYTGFKAPAAITSDNIYTMPAAFPAAASLWSISSAGVISAVAQVPTRRVFIPSADWVQANGTSMAAGMVGTYPNMYQGFQFVDAPGVGPQGILYQWRVPKDWASGTVTAKIVYRMINVGFGINSFFVMRLRTLAYAVGASPVGAATTVTTAIVNPLTYVNVFESSLGAITVAADNIVRIVIDRDTTDGSDDSTDTVNVIGVELNYTPLY
jgi:hypothetical protein